MTFEIDNDAPAKPLFVRTVAVDFDAVIAEYNGWKGKGVFGKPMPGVAEALSRLQRAGVTIIVNTTRSETDLIKKYLIDNNIPFNHINYNPDNIHYGLSMTKPLADVYVDDRGVTFNGEWSEAFVAYIMNFEPHWRRKMFWQCDKCKQHTDNLQIAWGTCGSQKVDVLDYFCPYCGHNELTFQGTKEQRDAWWEKEWAR